jgi:hypothetical protein
MWFPNYIIEFDINEKVNSFMFKNLEVFSVKKKETWNIQ